MQCVVYEILNILGMHGICSEPPYALSDNITPTSRNGAKLMLGRISFIYFVNFPPFTENTPIRH